MDYCHSLESASAEDTTTDRRENASDGQRSDRHKVIVQDTGDGMFYLVDYEGAISTVDALTSGHVSEQLEPS